jgi:hypothetical protein
MLAIGTDWIESTTFGPEIGAQNPQLMYPAIRTVLLVIPEQGAIEARAFYNIHLATFPATPAKSMPFLVDFLFAHGIPDQAMVHWFQ